jgi:pSer/pThr/pTyr-binding forkhead associated (FHA) protein
VGIPHTGSAKLVTCASHPLLFRHRTSLSQTCTGDDQALKRWLRSGIKKTAESEDRRGIELLVLAGVDTGQKFTIDADEVTIGRVLDDSELTGGVLLRDATVSARQALIRYEHGDYTVVHLQEATNPTMVNGDAVDSAILIPGSRIQIGRVVLDVRANDGTGLTDFTQRYAPAVPLKQPDKTDSQFVPEIVEPPTAEIQLGDMLEGPRPDSEIGWVEVREDPESNDTVRHSLRTGRTVIGRSAGCDLRVAELSVSRQHAEITWEGQNLVLVHKSGTNITMVNRQAVTDRMVLQDGDEIVLAGRVTMTLHLEASHRKAAAKKTKKTTNVSSVARGLSPELSGLRGAMEQKAALERRIAEDFSVFGSFVDIDVVNSMGMKTNIKEPVRIILSFERFRTFIAGIVSEFEGHVLNSNGDELMCFFESSHNAVRAGSAVFARLADFNKNENTLDSPFCFRIGVHTGQSLVDLKKGIAYSATLDMAGHLQKVAPTNRMAISEPTMASLPAGLPFKHEGTLDREALAYYLLEGFLD